MARDYAWAVDAEVSIDEATGIATAHWSDWSCVVRVAVDDADALGPAVADVRAVMNRVERAASRFIADSDLRWANLNPGRPIAVSRTLVALVDGALRAARASDGALDPTVGKHLDRIGYDRDILLVPDSDVEVPAAVVSSRGWRDVGIDRELGLITVPVGTALDLGATAKAQTADWAADQIDALHRCSALVEIGGDLAVAGPKDDWQIDVSERAGSSGRTGGQPSRQRISVRRGGVATSTTVVRTWQRAQRQVNHIIDPRTGWPVDGLWRTVTVASESAGHANACSTAAIVLGSGAERWLAGQGVAARLIGQAGEVRTVGPWPAEVVSSAASSTPADVVDLLADKGTRC